MYFVMRTTTTRRLKTNSAYGPVISLHIIKSNDYLMGIGWQNPLITILKVD